MPLDATGQYRHNDESAQFHSKAAGKEMPKKGEEHEGSGEHVEIHPHGDGTFHTMHQGEKVEHETHGHALIHAAKVHAEEGHKHFHAHHDGMEMHTHSVKAGEEPEHREGEEGAHEHLDEAMGEHEPDGDEAESEQQQPAGAGLGGLY